jgi:hypothetical protein
VSQVGQALLAPPGLRWARWATPRRPTWPYVGRKKCFNHVSQVGQTLAAPPGPYLGPGEPGGPDLGDATWAQVSQVGQALISPGG